MKNFGIKSDLALDFLKGDVYTTIVKTFEIKDGVKELSYHSNRVYNKKGDRTLSIEFEKTGEIRIRQVSKFDDHENIVGYNVYNAHDLLVGYGKYEYDSKGRLVSKSHDGMVEETYGYDDEGNIRIVSYPSTGGREIYEYDENGLAIKQLSLRDEDSLFGSLLGGPDKGLTLFENDEWGNIVIMKSYNADTKELLFTQKNKFNSQGDETESIGYNGDGTVHSYVKYEYQYDAKNNWILQRTLTKDGKVYREDIRSIDYYSD